MVKIIFEVHSTSLDNESRVASGHFDVDLSPTGIKQAEEMGDRYAEKAPDAVFCSDLKRAAGTAEIAFGQTGIPIERDARLRECDYGDYTRRPSSEIKKIKTSHIIDPFPNGQSYTQTTEALASVLNELKSKYEGGKVLIIGHAATHYGLEHLLAGRSLKDAIEAPWTWQPGWRYELR